MHNSHLNCSFQARLGPYCNSLFYSRLFPNPASNSDIVIANSRFLERPQKRSRRNQLIHGRLTKTKLIGSGQDPESQAGRQTVRRLWWMVFGVETGREVRGSSDVRWKICPENFIFFWKISIKFFRKISDVFS